MLAVLAGDELTVIRSSRYHQHDTYWSFDDPDQGRLRYREDEFLDEAGEVTGARSRLTLTGRTREDRFGAVLLFRSRYLAPAAHSARFYREYFRPAAEHVVEKERRRWLVAYRGVEFYVHLDRLLDAAGRRLLPRGQVADLVAARRARQGGGHHRAARAVRRKPGRHDQRRLRRARGARVKHGRGCYEVGLIFRTPALTRA